MFWANNIVNIALKFSFVYFQNDDLLKLLTLETVSYIIHFSDKSKFYLENKENINNVIIENVKNCEGNYDDVIIDSIKNLFPNIKFYISKSSCFWKYYDKK